MPVKNKAGYIYICAPYAGAVKRNVRRAVALGRWVYLNGGIPFIPHVAFCFFDEAKEREAALDLCCRAVKRSSAVYVFTDAANTITHGMRREITTARENNIPVRCFFYDKIIKKTVGGKKWDKKKTA